MGADWNKDDLKRLNWEMWSGWKTKTCARFSLGYSLHERAERLGGCLSGQGDMQNYICVNGQKISIDLVHCTLARTICLSINPTASLSSHPSIHSFRLSSLLAFQRVVLDASNGSNQSRPINQEKKTVENKFRNATSPGRSLSFCPPPPPPVSFQTIENVSQMWLEVLMPDVTQKVA